MSISIYLNDYPPLCDISFINDYKTDYKFKEIVKILGSCSTRLICFLQELVTYEVAIELYIPFVLDYESLKSICFLASTTIHTSEDYFKFEMDAFNLVFLKLNYKNDISKLAKVLRLRIVQHPDYLMTKQHLPPSTLVLHPIVPPIEHIMQISTNKDYIQNCNAYINLLVHGVQSAKPFLEESIIGLHPKITTIQKLIKQYPNAICVIENIQFLEEIRHIANCLSFHEFLLERLENKVYSVVILVDIDFVPIYRLYGADKCIVLLTEPESTKLQIKRQQLEKMNTFNGKSKMILDGRTRTLSDYSKPLRSNGTSIILTENTTPIKVSTPFKRKPISNNVTPQHIDKKAKIRTIHSESPQIPSSSQQRVIKDYIELEASCSDKHTDTSLSYISNTQDRKFIKNDFISSDLAIYKENVNSPKYKKPAFKPILVTQSEATSDTIGSLHEFVQEDIYFSSDYLLN